MWRLLTCDEFILIHICLASVEISFQRFFLPSQDYDSLTQGVSQRSPLDWWIGCCNQEAALETTSPVGPPHICWVDAGPFLENFAAMILSVAI
jgi:hypothetical protein